MSKRSHPTIQSPDIANPSVPVHQAPAYGLAIFPPKSSPELAFIALSPETASDLA